MAKSDELMKALAQTVGGEFILVELTKEGPQPVYDHRGQLLKFKDGKDAGKEARRLSAAGGKVQPRRATDPTWRDREAKRLADGTYKRLPWHAETWWKELHDIHKEHFPHAALAKGSGISFTENDMKGAADIQTVIRPGRYLERFFSDKMDGSIIRDLATVFSKHFEDNLLLFAETSEEIEEVYLNGPSSCMSKTTDSYGKLERHPVAMYGAGDLSVAYLRRNGKVAARSVVFTKKKLYNTIYGDKGRLEPLLKKAGLVYGPPVGARLFKYKYVHRDDVKGLYRYICPHLDNCGYVRDAGEHLVVEKSDYKGGSVELISVSGGAGISEPVGFFCSACDAVKDVTSRAVIKYLVGDRDDYSTMCHKCARKLLVSCSVAGASIEKTHSLAMIDGTIGRTKWVAQGHVVQDCLTGKYIWRRDATSLPDGRWVLGTMGLGNISLGNVGLFR